ncbi:TPA: primase C-terminal domain-containing protein [Staphylococcus aureus]|uniref:primase C-terminal domain-containing protein n=1 Tax=Staphylococcus sp. UMB10092B TaxID=3046317 RepID=UPI002556B846|nr:primase C-terminal domain-containing protein [Staphylococcus sp. UMB10092B]MDK7754062.1 primase C-terminal domain-containing protein [Staphylococcus sp. UMB10092B]
MLNINKIYDFILHGSIEKYKFKNSKATDLEKANFKAAQPKNWRSARIAVSPTKELLQNGYGVIFSSEEALVQYGHKFSHWTPNPYNYLSTKKKEDVEDKKVTNLYPIVNRTKDNVKQINTFVLDIDKDIEYNELVQSLASAHINEGVEMPNLYVKTPRGWHLYFVLDIPFYGKGIEKKALKVAEKVHSSLAYAISKYLPIDNQCVSTGYFRLPTKDNVKLFTNQYCIKDDMVRWSKEYSEKHNLNQNVFYKSIVNGQELTPEWVDYLLKEADVTSIGYGVGRNNTMFSVALYYYSKNVDLKEAESNIYAFNQRLANPLSYKEVERVIKSAYSGRYGGAMREHVENLLEAFSDGQIAYSNSGVSINGFWKHKKERKDRVRSHFDERKDDLERYLNEHTNKQKVFVKGSMSAIAKKLGMARSSLYAIFEKHINKGTIIKYTIKNGRYSETFIALKSVYIESLFEMVKSIKNKKESYITAIRHLVSSERNTHSLMVQNNGLLNEIENTLTYIDRHTQYIEGNEILYERFIS